MSRARTQAYQLFTDRTPQAHGFHRISVYTASLTIHPDLTCCSFACSAAMFSLLPAFAQGASSFLYGAGGDDLTRSTKVIALALVLQIVPAFGHENMAIQINALPVGTRIELRLSNKHKLRGVRGQSSNTGFTLVDDHTGERQIAFDDVVSVKRFQPHPVRNTLIVVGIVLVALGIVGSRV